jgi:hypothetical protein
MQQSEECSAGSEPPPVRRVQRRLEDAMLDDEQVAILRAIGSSVAFDDDKKIAKSPDLVLEGYVLKDGDLYELTSKGTMMIEERGCVPGNEANA